MRVLSRKMASRIAREERRQVMDALQAKQAGGRPFLRKVGFVQCNHTWLEWGGRLIFSIALACLVVFVNYLIFVRMLHYQFEFWR